MYHSAVSVDYVRQDQHHGGVDNGGLVRKGVSDGAKADRNIRGVAQNTVMK